MGKEVFDVRGFLLSFVHLDNNIKTTIPVDTIKCVQFKPKLKTKLYVDNAKDKDIVELYAEHTGWYMIEATEDDYDDLIYELMYSLESKSN